jgi:pimeloyl-ACP methyl ester carboxylesterase
MNRACAFIAVSLTLACCLWLAMSMSTGRSTAVVAALPVRAQQGIHTVTFQYGVSPSGYEGCDDTYMNSWSPNKNEGGHAELWVKGDGPQRALIKFDLSQHIPPGAQVRSATLTLHLNSGGSMRLVGYQVLQPWAEDQATWRQAQTGVPWWEEEGCGGSSRSTSPVCETDVTRTSGDVHLSLLASMVQTWVDDPLANEGILLQGESGGIVCKFASSERLYDPHYRPKLEVVYEGAPPLATPTPTLTPTKTPTPPGGTTLTSTVAGCLKVEPVPNHDREVIAGPGAMLLIWEGNAWSAELRVRICNTNPGKRHPIYLNGHLIGRTPESGCGNCECHDNLGCHGPDDYEVYEIAPNWLAQGPDYTNYITVTNGADYWDNVKAFSAHIVVHGDIIGATRSSFPIALDLNDVPLQGMAQLPIGYDPAVATPLLISVPGTGENRDDAVKRFAVQANQIGWLLASMDMRHVRWNDTYEQLARTPSLDVQQDVMKLLDYLQANYNVDVSRIYIAGFSTGGGIATTMAAKHPDVFAGVLDYSGPTDYAQWYVERGDLRTKLDLEFSGGPVGNFEYPRRSSRSLARNLRYVPIHIRHSTVGDDRVLFAHSQNLYEAVAPFDHKELIEHTLGHDDPGKQAKEIDLEFLSQHTRMQNPQELNIIADEGKHYYWLGVEKLGTAGREWQGFVEIDVRYDPGTSTIWVTAGDGDFAEGKPLTITLDLAKMQLNTALPYDIEEYDEETGDFSLHSAVMPADGRLVFTVPANNLGIVGRQYVIYPASGIELGRVRLQHGLEGYMGGRDTYITAHEPELSHGDADKLLLAYDTRRKALLKFDLSPVPYGVLIKAAKLTVHLLENRGTGIDVRAYELLRPWQDSEATWSHASQSEPWVTEGIGEGADHAATAEYTVENMRLEGSYSFNLKSLVQRWLVAPDSNYGLVLIGQGFYTSAGYPLAASEYGDSSRRPLLEIWYMNPRPTPTGTPTPTRTATPTATPSPTSTPTQTLTMPTPSVWRVYLPLAIK